jgi:hypothetical protein
MTESLIAVELDCSTGVVTERPFTAAEIAQREKDLAKFAAEKAAKEAEEKTVADAKIAAHAKLEALGLTAEEIAAISATIPTAETVVQRNEP